MAVPPKPPPEPIETDEVKVITVGTTLWGLAFLALLPFYGWLEDEGYGRWPWICLTGFGLGLIGIVYVRRRRAGLRRAGLSR
jgi:hypothetical protein